MPDFSIKKHKRFSLAFSLSFLVVYSASYLLTTKFDEVTYISITAFVLSLLLGIKQDIRGNVSIGTILLLSIGIASFTHSLIIDKTPPFYLIHLLSFIPYTLFLFLGLLIKHNFGNKERLQLIFIFLFTYLISILPAYQSLVLQFSVISICFFVAGLLYQRKIINKPYLYFAIIWVPIFLIFTENLMLEQKSGAPSPIIAAFALALGIYLKLLWKQKKILSGFIIVSYLTLALTFSQSIMSNWMAYRSGKISEVFIPAPEFEFYDQNGTPFNNKNLLGKVVVLDFWSTSCSVCFKQFPEFETYFQEYKTRKDIVIYSVNLLSKKDTEEKINKRIDQFIKQKGLEFPVLFSKSQFEVYGEKFGFIGVPTLVILNKNGGIHYVGSPNYKKELWTNGIYPLTEELLSIR